MSLTTYFASNDADANDEDGLIDGVAKDVRMNFLNVGSTNSLHVFVKSYIAKCVEINKDHKDHENVHDGDLSEQITDATIDYVRQSCPNFHQSPTPALRGVVQSILITARAIAKSSSPDGKPDKERYDSAVSSIVQSARAIFPQRAMFNLMARWSRKIAFHFQRDAIMS